MYCYSLSARLKEATAVLLSNQLTFPKALVVAGMFVASTCSSIGQDEKLSISLGADVLVPLGQLKTEVLTGFGGSAKLNLPLSRLVGITASIGFVSFEGKSDSSASFRGAPLRAGLKLYLIRGKASSIYCSGEAGLFLSTSSPTNHTGFSASPIMGFELPMGSITFLDISARYDYMDLSGRKRSSLGVRVAASFRL